MSSPEANAERELWVDGVRVISALLVVIAHLGQWGSGSPWLHFLAYTLSRNGVPLFFMLSGFLILQKQEPIGLFLRKRAARILPPLIAWSLIYDIYSNQALNKSGITVEAVFRLFIRMLRGPRAAHLWFFYALIGLYLFTPVLRLYIARARQVDLLYYIGLWFIVVPVLQILEAFTPLRFGFELQMFSGYVGYYLLGLFLGQMNFSPKKTLLAIFLFLSGFLFTFFVFFLNLPPKDDETVFRSYLSLNIVLMSSAAFFLLRRAFQSLPSSFLRKLLPMSYTTFGIYLVHPLILEQYEITLSLLGISRSTGPSLLMLPWMAFSTFVLSFLVIYLLQKIPFLHIIVPR